MVCNERNWDNRYTAVPPLRPHFPFTENADYHVISSSKPCSLIERDAPNRAIAPQV
jgi:hypothetical protein